MKVLGMILMVLGPAILANTTPSIGLRVSTIEGPSRSGREDLRWLENQIQEPASFHEDFGTNEPVGFKASAVSVVVSEIAKTALKKCLRLEEAEEVKRLKAFLSKTEGHFKGLEAQLIELVQGFCYWRRGAIGQAKQSVIKAAKSGELMENSFFDFLDSEGTWVLFWEKAKEWTRGQSQPGHGTVASESELVVPNQAGVTPKLWWFSFSDCAYLAGSDVGGHFSYLGEFRQSEKLTDDVKARIVHWLKGLSIGRGVLEQGVISDPFEARLSQASQTTGEEVSGSKWYNNKTLWWVAGGLLAGGVTYFLLSHRGEATMPSTWGVRVVAE